VLLSATTLRNICHREYALTMDPIKKQLQSPNKVDLALDGWTSTSKLAITSVIAQYVNRNQPLCEVQVAFGEVDCQCFSAFESSLRMISQGPAYWSKTSRTFEGFA